MFQGKTLLLKLVGIFLVIMTWYVIQMEPAISCFPQDNILEAHVYI